MRPGSDTEPRAMPRGTEGRQTPSNPAADTLREPTTELTANFLIAFIDASDDPGRQEDIINDWLKQDRAAAASRATEGLHQIAQRLVDAIATKAATDGLRRDGYSQGWKAEMDADDAELCALQDMRTALDGRDRPHRHVVAAVPEKGARG